MVRGIVFSCEQLNQPFVWFLVCMQMCLSPPTPDWEMVGLGGICTNKMTKSPSLGSLLIQTPSPSDQNGISYASFFAAFLSLVLV